MISITVANRDAEGAALVANRYVEQFMRYLMENVGGKNEYAVEYLRGRAEDLRKESVTAECACRTTAQEQLVSLDNSINIISERLRAINATLTDARLKRLDVETLLSQIDKMQKAGGSLLEIGYISSYGTIPMLKSQLADLLKSQSILSERYLERHPKMVDLANRSRWSRPRSPATSNSPFPTAYPVRQAAGLRGLLPEGVPRRRTGPAPAR